MKMDLAPAEPQFSNVARFGVAILVAFFGGFGGWATFAPLQTAAIAPAMIVVEGNRRTIQHLEGGIVGEILVRDGDRVDAGDVLLVLDSTLSAASVARLSARLDETLIRISRLRAERDGADAITFPPEIVDRKTDPAIRDAMDTQVSAFEARRDALNTEIDVLVRRKAQLEEEVTGLEQQIQSQDRQSALIRDELEGVKTLLEAGLERRPRYLALEREAAVIAENRAGRVASIARAGQAIGETDLRILDLKQVRHREALEQLVVAQVEVADLREQLSASQDVLARTEIRAPVDGIAVGSRIFTRGAVVAPGEPILAIVPENDRLIIEARINPIDIDSVREGLEAQIKLTAFNQRVAPTLTGTVVTVSADLIQVPNTDQSFYLTRISINDESTQLTDEVELYPGMPAEATIITGATTPLDYLLKPILSSVNRGMREE